MHVCKFLILLAFAHLWSVRYENFRVGEKYVEEMACKFSIFFNYYWGLAGSIQMLMSAKTESLQPLTTTRPYRMKVFHAPIRQRQSSDHLTGD